MSAHAGKKSVTSSPLVRFRQMAVIVAGIVAILVVPLFLVWKQAYIRNSSVRLEALTDTISAIDKEISLLGLQSERLSGIERIETFARASLGLEYPQSGRMVIVSMPHGNKRRPRSGGSGEQLASALSARDHHPKGGLR